MKISINNFNILIFKYRDVLHALQNENRNIANTNEYLINFIEEFDVQIGKRGEIEIYFEDGENVIGMTDIILYDYKNKSFVFEDEDFYYKLDKLYSSFRKLVGDGNE